MFKNCYYDTRNSIMHIWEQNEEGNNYRNFKWVPYVFVESDRGNVKTLEGKTVFKKNFKDYGEYNRYCKHEFAYEDRIRPEIQFLAEQYSGIPDDELYIPDLRIYSIDIEVHFEDEFPNPEYAKYPIVLISVKDSKTGVTFTFGVKKYTGDKDIKFIYCKDEKDLMKKFISFMHKFPPDVITGWNVYGFDVPYIINRSDVLFPDYPLYNKMSPINVVRTWKSQGKFNKEVINTDIAGVTILDMMDLYKWYSRDNLESYTLDFVAHHELGTGKVDYSEHVDLRQLYYENWNMYVDYNAVDAEIVQQLEDKLGYVKLVQALSLITRVPMKYYHVQTALIEGILITHYRRNNICAPHFAGGSQTSYPAAFVKEPQRGKHYWVVDLDIASSYPSHIITLNMSPETYYGRILGMTEDDIINYTKTKSFPKFDLLKNDKLVTLSGRKLKSFNQSLQKKILSVSPCGSVFNNTKMGIFAELERDLFAKRKQTKGKMIQNKKDLNKIDDEEEISKMKELINQQNSKQLALKVLLNAVYGITAVPYSRYFNTNIAEAITSCGRVTIKAGDTFSNDLMNDVESHSPETVKILDEIGGYEKKYFEKDDYVSYIDTDSVFLCMERFITRHIEDENRWYNLSDQEKIEYILRISKEIEKYVNERVYEETQGEWYNSNVEDFRITFKQEIVAKSVLFIKKKKYAFWCVNEEGAPVDKLSVTGLEIVRSDSSESFRDRLKDIMNLILRDASDNEIRDKVMKYKKELKEVYPEEIAATVTVNNINKYIKDNMPIKGTPWHVKGVANYRKMLDILELKNEYEDIAEGIKGRVVYLKNNKYGFDTVTFLRWPREFNDVVQIDYETMIEKFFVKKIESFLEPMGKTDLLHENKEERMDLFFD